MTAGQIFLKNAKSIIEDLLRNVCSLSRYKTYQRCPDHYEKRVVNSIQLRSLYFFFLHCLPFDTLHQTAGLFILTYPYTFLAASHFWRGCCNPQKIRGGVVI